MTLDFFSLNTSLLHFNMCLSIFTTFHFPVHLDYLTTAESLETFKPPHSPRLQDILTCFSQLLTSLGPYLYLLLLAQSNRIITPAAREWEFGILKKKTENKKNHGRLPHVNSFNHQCDYQIHPFCTLTGRRIILAGYLIPLK